MNKYYRDILKHSGVYGVGQILGRLASVLLLPLYTRYLSPADYGVIAILDVTTGVLGILLGGGMVSAVGRYHFDAKSSDEESAVWWTGIAVVTAISTVLVLPALFGRHLLATLTIGAQEASGGYFYALALATLWFSSITNVPDQYMRVRKWSWVTVALSIAFLVLNVALNVYFLTVLHLGVAGVLWGNLITGAISTLIRCAVLAVMCRPIHFNLPLASHLWRFGGPLVAVALLSTVMHQADRFFLRMFLDLNQVGVYALAYTIGQGVNSFVLTPFYSVWDVVVYEVAHRTDAERIYVLVFEYFLNGLMLILFGVSLFAQPLVSRFLPAEYGAAGWLIPIVCLAFVFFSLHGHFRVPAMLAKRTGSMILSPAIAATANVILNLLLIPRIGMIGAALTSIVTYAIYSIVGLVQYRRIRRFDYPFRRCGFILLAMIATFEACQAASAMGLPMGWSLAARALVWLGWAAVLLLPILKRPFELPSMAAAS